MILIAEKMPSICFIRIFLHSQELEINPTLFPQFLMIYVTKIQSRSPQGSLQGGESTPPGLLTLAIGILRKYIIRKVARLFSVENLLK